MEILSNYLTENINQKRIVITGGTTGIGKAIADVLVSLGGRVLIFGRDEHDFYQAMDDIKTKSTKGEIFGATADITKKEDVQRIWQQVDSVLGGIDILINNAALPAGGLIEGEYDDWKYILETNILGYIAFAKEAVNRMKEKKSGHIVNIGSMSAEVKEKTGVIYVATKTAIRGFSTALRKEINPLGIKVSHVEPGAVMSDIRPSSKEEQKEKIEKMEMLEAEDIAMSVLFCLAQPKRCDIVSMQVRPHLQII
ncbi:SDR family oxidoreductase [Flavobacterium sp. 17A]|uniref:SDR family oxidoreductase n=1 Tax=Flavobacterium potami TaxID=2872310 RepID=A0A9X1KNT2_9FLAO|nr:SDR family oxidoreductase [Flavobacterium potami]MBZ4033397.1 SDR family oxidoreductase [Flavobacterium potami]